MNDPSPVVSPSPPTRENILFKYGRKTSVSNPVPNAAKVKPHRRFIWQLACQTEHRVASIRKRMALQLSNQQPPLSLDSARRRATAHVQHVNHAISEFRDLWMADATISSRERLLELMTELFWKSKLDKALVQLNLRQFDTLLGRFKTDVSVCEKPEYAELVKICERNRLYNDLRIQMRKQLNYVIKENLQKYCVSFSEEATSVDIKPVLEYESKIINNNVKLKKLFDKLDELKKRYKDKEASIFAYVKSFQKNIDNMKDTMGILRHVCVMCKEWILHDETYPRMLRTEIARVRNYHSMLTKQTKDLRRRREHMKHETLACDLTVTRMSQSLKEQQNRERKYEQKQMALYQIQNKARDHDEEEKLIHHFGLDAFAAIRPETSQSLRSPSASSMCSIIAVPSRCQSAKSHISRLQQEEATVSLEIMRLETDLEKKVAMCKNTQRKLEKESKYFKEHEERIQYALQKITVSQKILDMKVNRTIFKELFKDKYGLVDIQNMY